MKRIIVISLLAFAFTLVLTPISNAQMAKEGGGQNKLFYSLHFNMLPMGEDIVQVNYEGYGVSHNEIGESTFNNASIHFLGSFLATKGAYENDSGLMCFTRPDGDQIFATYKSAGQVGKEAKGTYTLVGGTGKFVGVQGKGEYVNVTLRPITKEVGAGLTVSEGSWKIVEPTK
jgi:hypothetical protein